MFDASLFRMTAPEAAATDPQQRILLEETFITLHAANNLLNEPLSSHCGIFLKLSPQLHLDSIHKFAHRLHAFVIEHCIKAKDHNQL